jgi:NDP-sugar pyrophosphorylase family protein
MFGMRFDGYWIDCGRREDLLRAFWTLMGNDAKKLDKGSVWEGASVSPPCIVRTGAVVAGATIGPRAYVSEGAVVGPMSKIERSVILEDARIGSKCRVIDSIVDSGVTVPDGSHVSSTILSNAREPQAR